MCARHGRRVRYTTLGEGPPVALVHGVHAAASSFEMRGIFEPLSRQHAVYAVDLAPIDTEIPFADALARVAEKSGGRYFQNVVSLNTPLQQVAEETSGYYLISYSARHPRGGSGFQPVRVLLQNPEFRVTARAGYLYGE